MAKETIFVDTSAWYATIDKNDRDHRAAVAKIQNLDHPLVTSNYIFDETLTLLKTRLNSTIAIQFGQKLWNQEVATVIRITEEDEARELGQYFANTKIKVSVLRIARPLL